MVKKSDISFSRKEFVLLCWVLESSFDFLSSFENFCEIDVSELKDLKDYICDCFKNKF